MPPVSPRCTEEPLVEPFRTAVSAEMAKSGQALHLPSVGVMHPSWWWSWLRVGVTKKRFVKMNYRVRNRNATTRVSCRALRLSPLSRHTRRATGRVTLSLSLSLTACIPSLALRTALAVYVYRHDPRVFQIEIRNRVESVCDRVRSTRKGLAGVAAS